jgi:hypothetical protein
MRRAAKTIATGVIAAAPRAYAAAVAAASVIAAFATAHARSPC